MQAGERPSLGCSGWVVRSRTPPLAGHCGGATMVQGGLHRGVAVCEGMLDLLVVQPAQGL